MHHRKTYPLGSSQRTVKPSRGTFCDSRGAFALSLLLSGLLVGCAGSQKGGSSPNPPPATTEPPAASATPVASPARDKPVELSLRIDALSASKGALSLQPGDSLRSGDQIAISVTVDQPAYVYIAVASSSEPAKLVFPKSGDQQVQPGQVLRIPGNAEKWIPLDFKIGEDDIFAYAAVRPIPSAELLNLISADAEAAKKSFAKRAAKSASKPLAKPAPKPTKAGKPGPSPAAEEPGGLSANSRGLTISDEDTETEAAPTPPAHISAKRFFLIHK